MRHRNGSDHLSGARQLSLRGADALDRSRYQDAEALFTEALQSCPTDERAHWGYAQTLWQKGSHEQSIEHMKEALRLSEKNVDYMVRLGEMYLDKNDLPNARAQAQKAIDHDHRNAAAWALMGNTLRQAKEWGPALNCYQRALLVQSDYPQVQLAAADCYRHIGRPQRALATLDRMTDLHGGAQSTPDAMMIRGLALADLGRNEDAIGILNRASEKLPIASTDQHLQLAAAQYRLGDLVQARMTLGRVLQAHPDHFEAKRLQSTLDMSFQHLANPMMPEGNRVLR